MIKKYASYTSMAALLSLFFTSLTFAQQPQTAPVPEVPNPAQPAPSAQAGTREGAAGPVSPGNPIVSPGTPGGMVTAPTPVREASPDISNAGQAPFEIQGGASYANAVPVETGRRYRLNHHQKRAEYDYFTLDLRPGQALVATLSTEEKGVEVKPDNTFADNPQPHAGMYLFDASGNRLGSEEITGTPKTQRQIEVETGESQRVYVLLGSAYGPIHKEGMVFGLEVKNYFDADSDSDAGSSPETSIPLEKGRAYSQNYITRSDDADFFRIPTVAGEKVSLNVTLENPATTLNASLYDELRVEISRASSPQSGVLSIQPGAGFEISGIAKGATTYLKIHRNLTDPPTRYSLVFAGTPTPTPAPTPTAAPTTAPETSPVLPPETQSPTPAAETAPSAPPVSTPPTGGASTSVETPPQKPEKPETTSKPTVAEKDPKKSGKKDSQAIPRTAPLQWTDPQPMKFVSVAFGSGLLLGLMGAFLVVSLKQRRQRKKESDILEP